MVVDGFASLKTDQDKLVAGQRNLEDELGRVRSLLDSPVPTTMARGGVKGHVGERSSAATERTTSTSGAADGLATDSTAEVVASVGAAAGSVSRVQAPDSSAPSPVSLPENEGERPESTPTLQRLLALADRADRMSSFLDSLEEGERQTPSVQSVREVTVDSGVLEVSLVPQEVRDAVTGGAHQEMEVRDERGGVEVTRSSPTHWEVQRPRVDSNERPSDLVVRTATRSGPSTAGSTANVLASAGSVGAAAGGARSVSRVQAPDSPVPSSVSPSENEGERREINPTSQKILALGDRMDRMSSPLDLLVRGAGETPSVHSIREVTVGSGDLDESSVPGEATEAAIRGAHEEREVREERGGLEVTRSSPMREEVQRPRMDSDDRPSDLVERPTTPSAAGVGLTTGSTADVLASAGSVGVAAGGADSVSRVPAPDSPAPSPVASSTTEAERPQIIPTSQQLLALANRVSRLYALPAPAAGDAAEASGVPSSRGVTVGSGVLDVSLAPQDATETLASPPNEAERPKVFERVLALVNRLSKFNDVLATAAGDAGETSSARSVLEVTVGSGDLAVSRAPGEEKTEAVTRGAPKSMEGRDDRGVEVTSQMSDETPVVEATVASGGLVLEVEGAQLEVVEEITGETAGSSRETVPGEGTRVARPPVSWAETAERVENPIAAAEKVEVPAAENGVTAVETVAVTPGSLTIKTRKVSSEERQMAGAPQGQIFDVVALKSSEVPASVDISKDLEAVRIRSGVTDWASLFAAVSSARTLVLHHRDMFGGENGGPGLIGRLVSLVADAVSNRRSVVQTNGLRCLGEMFSCVVGKEMTADQMGTLVRSTLSCHKSSSKFCGEEARKAMEAALANADPEPLLSAVLPLALDTHPKRAAWRGAVWWMVWT
ncbi:hypothetical protein Esi_1052_0001 [Ectocarpus siliculosus]|uniref:CLASP N-terminal domain-containing protein n=1 Tax=Ectocarpus siliculosus TaxID=2880 RepID=D7FH72_ECTSI|nr:hypothetical protein Esi_1052_0001 [Ectocarpus siliculosus]|eukprot:CBJ34120.1 hypothetical protein Esi_1052_0001 [Ectocarpus siliculosus]